MILPAYGDVIGCQGRGWLSDNIRKLTGNGPLSHVGICTADSPFSQVTQALSRVVVTAWEEVLDANQHVWILRSPLTPEQRNVACRNALKHTGETYAYWNILMQLADSETGSEWFSDHWDDTRRNICSQLDAVIMPDVALRPKDATPNDFWGWWTVERYPIEQAK